MHTDKKENKIFLIYKEIQSGAVAKSYTSLNRLIVKQKEAIIVMSNVCYRDHTGPLFKLLKILPIENIVKFLKT